MGRNAKFLKKVKKSTTSQSGSTSSQKPSASQPVAEQRRKAGLKAKAYKRKPGSDGHVLGGADYVSLMMGSRRKAKEEAAKLPKDPEDS
ncbi:hypothetical protein BC629DRAFT_314322 [Irpex lacteus]|nr:hypothetical protein BC629DRAFT_314322 [Irpex lacteus]